MSNDFESVENHTPAMTKYLTTLIQEKGRSIHDEIEIDGHFGLTWSVLIDYIQGVKEHHSVIKDNLVKIDFMNGDVFHFLTYLANSMIQAQGLDQY